MDLSVNFKESLQQGKIRSSWESIKNFILYHSSDRDETITEIEKCNQIFDQFVLEFFINNPVININEEKLKKIPNLSIENEEGFSDYIDFIDWNDIKKPIMKGIDIFNRPFFTMKLCLLIIKPENKIKTKFFPQTFFQRYSNINNNWVTSGINGLIFTTGGMNREQYKMLNDLIEGKTIEVSKEHGINFNSNNKYLLMTFNKWEEKAVKIIQKNWRIFKSKAL